MANLRDLYLKYKPCIVRVTVISRAGDHHTGTGFHIGDGLIVTARHVVQETVRKPSVVGEVDARESMTIDSVTRELDEQALTVTKHHYHSDHTVDLVVLETDFEAHPFPDESSRGGVSVRRSVAIPIGSHVDDWLSDQFVLCKVLIMGYPIVQWAKSSVLITTEAEVNALVHNFRSPHPYFIISSTARGGFSGAPVICAAGSVIGVVIEALYGNDKPEETGFNAAITLEPLITILVDRGIQPSCIPGDIWARFLKARR